MNRRRRVSLLFRGYLAILPCVVLFAVPLAAGQAAAVSAETDGQPEAPPQQEITSIRMDGSRLVVGFDFPRGFHQEHAPEMFGFTVAEPADAQPAGWQTGELVYPEPNAEFSEVASHSGYIEVWRRLSRREASADETELEVSAYYQLCSDQSGQCFFPETETHRISVPLSPQFASAGALLLYMLAGLAGGFLLNLMPCVLPVLSLKTMQLLQSSTASRRQLLGRSWAYAAGILVSFWVLAGAVILLQASGRVLGWGFQFQNPGFLLFLTVVMFLFALSLFDVFTIYPPQGMARAGSNDFATGVLAVLLATPCTAPLLGTAMGFAFSRTPPVILLIFTMTGIGLALPFLLLGLMPGLVQRLPRPGAWMQHMKAAMGFLLMGFVVYMLHWLYSQIGGGILSVLRLLVWIALAARMLGLLVRPTRRRSVRLLGLALASGMILGGTLVVRHGLDSWLNGSAAASNRAANLPEDESSLATIAFSQERLAELQRAGIPVFLEFTADWCTTCRINRETVLKTAGVRELFDTYGVQWMQADLTLPDDEITLFMRDLGRSGVPVYALYSPQRPDPYLLSEVITSATLERAFAAHVNAGR